MHKPNSTFEQVRGRYAALLHPRNVLEEDLIADLAFARSRSNQLRDLDPSEAEGSILWLTQSYRETLEAFYRVRQNLPDPPSPASICIDTWRGRKAA